MHGWDFPVLYHAVAARYGFAKVPNDFGAFHHADGAKFEIGRFTTSHVAGSIPASELLLFNDGIIAACADTNLAEWLLDDVMEWMISSGFLRPSVTLRPRTYVSHVIVQFDKLAPDGLKHIFGTAGGLDAALAAHYGDNRTMSLSRLTFSVDPRTSSSPGQHIGFTLERRAHVPYDQNWFWSSAPLPLAIHLSVLETMEDDFVKTGNILSGR